MGIIFALGDGFLALDAAAVFLQVTVGGGEPWVITGGRTLSHWKVFGRRLFQLLKILLLGSRDRDLVTGRFSQRQQDHNVYSTQFGCTGASMGGRIG